MKKSITTILLGLALTIPSFSQDSIKEREARAQQVAAYYQQAAQAYNDGDLHAAKESLKNALAINPNHAQSYALSLQLKKNGSSFKAQNRQRMMTKIILKQVQIEDMPLGEAMDILSKLIEKQTKDAYIPNFVIQDNTGILKSKKVTLDLKNIPASVALDYMLEQSGAVSRFDEYAINIRSRRPLEKADGEPEKKEFGEK